MDGRRFDALIARAASSRRSLFSLLAGLIAGTLYDGAESKRGKKKKVKGKAKKKSPPDPWACESSLTCPDNTFCQKKRCVTGCETNDDCSPDRYCGLIEGLGFGFCEVGCRDHQQCALLLGTRLSRCNFSNQCELLECINDGDCTPPKTCRDNFTCT